MLAKLVGLRGDLEGFRRLVRIRRQQNPAIRFDGEHAVASFQAETIGHVLGAASR